jgi:hypothetical protein
LVLCNKVEFCFAVLENSLTFAPEFRHHSGGVRKDLIEKSVIEIIFNLQILAKFEMERR